MAGCRVFGVSELPLVADFIKSGGVLAYPSESVWGLGCDAFNERAIIKIFKLKNRPEHKGLIVLTDGVERLAPLLQGLPKKTQSDLMAKMHVWHGEFDIHTTKQAQTWLLPAPSALQLPKVLTGGLDTLAVRATHHPALRQICHDLTSPLNPFGFLVSTSCNPSGAPPAQSLAQAMDYFGEQVAYLDAQNLGFKLPSQIIDVLGGRILR